MKAKYITNVGDRFGSYEVIEPRGGRSLCRCRCGVEVLIYNKNLCTRTNPKCRACFAKMARYGAKVTHAVYNAISRCTNPSHKRYADWGGRGISVFPPWVSDPGMFCQYLCALDGANDHSLVLDRVHNDGNYEPGNLRWVTRSESQKNRRQSVRSAQHCLNLSRSKRGRPWTSRQREAYERRAKCYSSSP